MNIIEIINKFSTQKDCIEYLEKAKWNNKPVCPYCGSTNSYPVKSELRHKCRDCKKSFSVTVGTIFHHTHIPITKWFLAIILILNAKKGISSRQLARDLQVTKDTAWSMQMRIRKAMKHDGKLLKGIVEMDEVYIGGDPKNKHKKDDDSDNDNHLKRGRGTKKTAVVGIIERKGNVVAEVTQGKNKLTFKALKTMFDKFVDKKSVLMTDEFSGYKPMKRNGINHSTVNHNQGEYVDGNCHTNTIEGFWSLLKRGITGQYHWLSDNHLCKYIDEFCYKYNNRENPSMFEDLMSKMLGVEKMASVTVDCLVKVA